MSENSGKVWQKEGSGKLHPAVEKFEIGSDYLLDGELFYYELAASQAHAQMLESIGILSAEERKSVDREIRSLYQTNGRTIVLSPHDEDIHSKLEGLLTETIGDTGKKIHTGRSRNDQVMVVMRLFEKDLLIDTAQRVMAFLKACLKLAETQGDKILPGYTHTKQAMLQNVKMWAGAFVELGLDNLEFLSHVYQALDANPLGSGSGFGVPIPLNRDMTAKLLGFSKVQENPAAVQNSRGKLESRIIDGFWNVMNDLSRMAADLLMFNMDELMFVKTDSAITTGSSIMPQKRNLDVMELVRARANTMLGYSFTVKSVVSGIHSGYNRDLQETKEPLFRAASLVRETLDAVEVVIGHIEFDDSAVKKALTPGIFATDIAFEAVGKGMPFRDAYRLAAKEMDTIKITDEVIRESLEKRVSPGSPATIDLSRLSGGLKAAESLWKERGDAFHQRLSGLVG